MRHLPPRRQVCCAGRSWLCTRATCPWLRQLRPVESQQAAGTKRRGAACQSYKCCHSRAFAHRTSNTAAEDTEDHALAWLGGLGFRLHSPFQRELCRVPFYLDGFRISALFLISAGSMDLGVRRSCQTPASPQRERG